MVVQEESELSLQGWQGNIAVPSLILVEQSTGIEKTNNISRFQ